LKARDFMRTNRWSMVAMTCLTGFLLGLCLRRTTGCCSR
jgi:hypothetical protein